LGKGEGANAEAKTQDVGSSTEENCGGAKGTLGGVPSSEEEGCLAHRRACCELCGKYVLNEFDK
jgi:hypothetical protein